MNKMNLLITLSMVFLFQSCSKEDTLKGSGNIVSESRDIANFTEVYNPTSVNMVIIEGTTQEVELSADDNVISSIKTIVENGILKVDLVKSNYIDVSLTVSVTMANLRALKNTGSGSMNVSGFDALTAITIENEGSGTISFSGSTTSLSLKNSGSGSYKGFGCISENCLVTNSGSGDCEINCTNSLDGTNSGSGSVFYKGSPTVDVTNTGSGMVVDSN